MPSVRAWCTPCKSTGWPLNSRPPSVGRCTPARIWISVDLPAPFSPNKTWTSPGLRSKSMPAGASPAGNCIDRPRARKTGVGASAAPTLSAGANVAAANSIYASQINPASVDRENRLPVRGGERRRVVERIDVRLVDHVDLRPDMLEIELAFEDAHRLIDRDASLHHCGIRRRRHYPAGFDVVVNARREVIGQHLDLVREVALAQELHGGFGRRRSADDVFDIRIGLQHVLDQFQLHFLAGVAVFGGDHLEPAVLDGVVEALVAGFDPTGAGRSRKPGDFDFAGALGVLLGDIFSGLKAHGLE